MRRGCAPLLALAVVACSGGDSAATPRPAGTAIVVHPVDGDTIVVDIDGVEEPVRFIGIDTPESVAPDRPVECFGPEAKARTAELLPEGTVVRLERDVEARDRYDRLLAYVIRDQRRRARSTGSSWRRGTPRRGPSRRTWRTRTSSTEPRPARGPPDGGCGPPAAAPTHRSGR